MKFLAFIKQVPEVSEISFDLEKKTLIRSGVKNGINPYDRRAISEAIRYKSEKAAEVIVATMGPPQAREALSEALLMGADRAIHIQDSRLAGSDTLVTARVLAAAARKIGFDILMCGLHSTDSETGQVPPELAELLGVPCAAAVRKIEYQGDQAVLAYCETDEGTTIVDLLLPAVISTAERLIKPIKMKGVDLSAAPSEKIEQWTIDDLQLSAGKVGLEASPTRVADIYNQRITRRPEIWDGSNAAETAKRILEKLRTQYRKRDVPPVVPERTLQGERQYWCWIEHDQGNIRPVSLEMLGSAALLAGTSGGTVSAIHAGPALSPPAIELLSSCGADNIYSASSNIIHPDDIVALLCAQIVDLKPYAFFMPATSQGKYLAPRVAARLGLGLTGDCVGLQLDDQGRLVHLKPAFGGNFVAPIYCSTFPQFATIRPGALSLFRPRSGNPIPVVSWTFPYNVPHQSRILSQESDSGMEAAKMESAKVVVCVGMGLGQQNVQLAFDLAELLQGAVGATRRVVDAGWLPRQFQVGLTGKFIAPQCYLGLGVSGKYNHTIGIQKANTILAINSDLQADIFKTCDTGVIGDCAEITRQMIRTFEKE